jgi:beta-lactamase regulating signal transducer with metallopeptidase domain
MPWSESLCWWLAYSALLSLLVLVLGSGATLLCRQPARRLRIIELTLAGCLLAPLLGLLPGYPQLSVAWHRSESHQQHDELSRQYVFQPSTAAESVVEPMASQPDVVRHPIADPPSPVIAAPTETPLAPAHELNLGQWLVGLYLAGVAIGLAWWLLGLTALLRIVRGARVAPPRCKRLLAEIAGRRGVRVRLLASRLAKQPFASVGMAVQLPSKRVPWPRPVIVLPKNLCDDEQAVRWALAHEWTHIEQRDFRAWFVAGLVRVLFFYQPLVWWLRRQLRLCQDFVADARASREAAEPEDYAEFLAARAAGGLLHPAMVGLGMGFSKSELYRRVVMLVQNRPLESRPPRLWTVSVTCFAMALIGVAAALTASPPAAAQGETPAEVEAAPASPNHSAVAKKIDVTMGPSQFAKGDKITIQEVWSEQGTLTKGDTVTVKGTYTLKSQPNATLAFWITQDANDPIDYGGGATTPIKAGTASFEIKRVLTSKGHLHLAFSGKHETFGTVYFGTKPQVAEIAHGKPDAKDADKRPTGSAAPAKAKLTLDSLGFMTMSSGPGNDEETGKLLKEKKYELVKTFDSNIGKQYVYRFTYPDGRHVNRNFPTALDGVTSWADYEKKDKQREERRSKHISEALTSGRFRLLDLDVMQLHVCRDVASGKEFKVQRIGRGDQSEIALPRVDLGTLPSGVQQTSWQEHLQAIRDGKRQLLKLETVNDYTYEMTGDDGTKEIFGYGGQEPLEEIIKRKDKLKSSSGAIAVRTHSTSRKHDATEDVIGDRPKGNCSLGGKLLSESTGKPIAGAKMYMFYLKTYAAIFVHTDKDGEFIIKDIPKGPYSFRSSHTAGYQDAVYDPDHKSGQLPEFTLKDGEQRLDLVLKAKEACRVSGKIVDENGNVPSNIQEMVACAWFKNDRDYYTLAHGSVKPDGSYVIDGLGGKPVYVMAKDYHTEDKGGGLPPIYALSTFFRGEARLITFDKSRHVDGVNITLRKTGGLVLEGTVRDENGKPIPEAFVVVHHRDMLFDRVTAYTDSEGRYELQGLGDGEVLVHVDAIHRGFVRTRVPIVLEKKAPAVQRDFTLHRGVSISGKLVDQDGKEWQIGRSYGGVHVTSNLKKPHEGPSWSGLPNKFGVQSVRETGSDVFYIPGEGDYDVDNMVFPTSSTFLFPSVKPGHTRITFSPQAEGQEVVKILCNGKDILKSGITTKPGDEIKDVTIVIGAK